MWKLLLIGHVHKFTNIKKRDFTLRFSYIQLCDSPPQITRHVSVTRMLGWLLPQITVPVISQTMKTSLFKFTTHVSTLISWTDKELFPVSTKRRLPVLSGIIMLMLYAARLSLSRICDLSLNESVHRIPLAKLVAYKVNTRALIHSNQQTNHMLVNNPCDSLMLANHTYPNYNFTHLVRWC